MWSLDRLVFLSPVVHLLAYLVLTGSAAAQRVWIVDKVNGPGANFTELQPAVDASSVGDTLVVRSGNYLGPLVTKGITIVTAPAASVRFDGSFIIRNIPKRERCFVDGLSSTLPFPSMVLVEDNMGMVQLERVGIVNEQQGFTIRRSEFVVLSGCGAKIADIDQSIVLMIDSGISAPRGPKPFTMTIKSSKLILVDSSIAGSPGELYPPSCTVTYQPGPGMVAFDTEILMSGFRSFIAGGAIDGGMSCAIRYWAPQVLGTNCRLTYDPTVFPKGMLDVRGTSVFAVHVPSLAVNADWGGQFRMIMYGTANAPVMVLGSQTSSPAWLSDCDGTICPVIPGPWLDPSRSSVIYAGLLDSSGWRTVQMQIPVFLGVPAVFQALVASPRGLGFSPPAFSILN